MPSEIADNPAKINRNNEKSKNSSAIKTTELKTGVPNREVIILKFKPKTVATNGSKHDNEPKNSAVSSKHNDNEPSSSAIVSGKSKNVVRVNVNPGKVPRFKTIKDNVNKLSKDGSRKFATDKTGRISNASVRNESTVKRLKKAADSDKLINARPEIGKANANVRKPLEIVSEPTKPDVIIVAIIGIIEAITETTEMIVMTAIIVATEMIGMTAITAITEIAGNTTAISRDGFSGSVGRNIIKEINGEEIATKNARDSFREKDGERIFVGSKGIMNACVRIACGCKERGITII